MSKRQRFDSELLGSSFAHNAETAVVAPPVPKSLDIRTPCHGMPLKIYTSETGGSGYMTYEEPSEIICSADGCYNTWTPDGTLE